MTIFNALKQRWLKWRYGLVTCIECSNYADKPSNLCVGCDAYRDHTGGY